MVKLPDSIRTLAFTESRPLLVIGRGRFRIQTRIPIRSHRVFSLLFIQRKVPFAFCLFIHLCSRGVLFWEDMDHLFEESL